MEKFKTAGFLIVLIAIYIVSRIFRFRTSLDEDFDEEEVQPIFHKIPRS